MGYLWRDGPFEGFTIKGYGRLVFNVGTIYHSGFFTGGGGLYLCLLRVICDDIPNVRGNKK